MLFNHEEFMVIRHIWSRVLKVSCLGIGVLVLLTATDSFAKIYKYKDENGKTHFTDDLSKIPAKYRKDDKLKTMDGVPADPSAPVGLNLPEANTTGDAIPVERSGEHFIVKVTFNGNIKAKLMVDTGASMVVVSERLGKLLRVTGRKDLPIIESDTAGGKVESPLFILKSMKVGRMKEYDIEATTNPHFKDSKSDGLLGMSFLGEYKVEVDRTNNKLYLKPTTRGKEKLWGGKNEAWWRNKYTTYAKKLRYYHYWLQNGLLTQKQIFEFRKMHGHYSKLYEGLEKRGKTAYLPEEFRVDP